MLIYVCLFLVKQCWTATSDSKSLWADRNGSNKIRNVSTYKSSLTFIINVVESMIEKNPMAFRLQRNLVLMRLVGHPTSTSIITHCPFSQFRTVFLCEITQWLTVMFMICFAVMCCPRPQQGGPRFRRYAEAPFALTFATPTKRAGIIQLARYRCTESSRRSQTKCAVSTNMAFDEVKVKVMIRTGSGLQNDVNPHIRPFAYGTP